MIIIAIIISIFFIVVIAIICRSYTKDIFELENRILQLEKRINITDKELKGQVERFNDSIENIYTIIKEEVDNMACGRRGRPRGSHNTTHGGRKK